MYEVEPMTCHCLHSLQDEDTMHGINGRRVPVTQIRFKMFELGDKPEHKKILIASC